MRKNTRKKVRNIAIIGAALGLTAGGSAGIGVAVGQHAIGAPQSVQNNVAPPPIDLPPTPTPTAPDAGETATVQAIYNEVVATYFNTIPLVLDGGDIGTSSFTNLDLSNPIRASEEIPLQIDALPLELESQENFLLLLFESLDDPVYNAFFNTGTVSDVSFNGVRLRISNSDIDDQLLGTYDTEITIDGLSLNFNPFGNPNDPAVAAFTQRLEYGRQLGGSTDVPILGSILIDDILVDDDEGVNLEDVELIGDELLRSSIPPGTEALLEIFRVQYFNVSLIPPYEEGDFRNELIDSFIFPNFLSLLDQLGLFVQNLEDFDVAKITGAQLTYYNSDNIVYIDPNNSNSLQITLQVERIVFEYDGTYHQFSFIENDYRSFVIFNLITSEGGGGYDVDAYGSLSLDFNDSVILDVPGDGEEPGDGNGEEPGDGNGEEPGDGNGEEPGDGNGEEPGDGNGEEPGDGNGEEPGDGNGEEPGDGNGEEPGDGTTPGWQGDTPQAVVDREETHELFEEFYASLNNSIYSLNRITNSSYSPTTRTEQTYWQLLKTAFEDEVGPIDDIPAWEFIYNIYEIKISSHDGETVYKNGAGKNEGDVEHIASGVLTFKIDLKITMDNTEIKYFTWDIHDILFTSGGTGLGNLDYNIAHNTKTHFKKLKNGPKI